MPDLIPFAFDDSLVRSRLDENGQPWFVVADVCAVLGLSNPTVAIQTLDDDEKSTLRITEGGPERNLISESGLYSLIFRSNKPEAKRFRKWVTSEVLPAIHKTGSYRALQLSREALPESTEEDRKRLDRVPDVTKRAAIKELTALAKVNPERAATLEADILRLLLALAPSSQRIQEYEKGTWDPPLTKIFWKAFEALENKGMQVNHHPSVEFVAVRLCDFPEMFLEGNLFEAYDKLLSVQPSALKASLRRGVWYPFYQEDVNIKSIIEGKYVSCWVFYKPLATDLSVAEVSSNL